MNDMMDKFSPDELGLERIMVDGHCYIDITPLYLDSARSIEVYNRIEQIKTRRETDKRLRDIRKREAVV